LCTSIVITSGKGGTGKSTCTGAIATALALMGNKTLCIDCDVGLKNLDLILGLSDEALWDFSDVLNGNTDIKTAIIPHPKVSNLFLLSAPSNMTADEIDSDSFADMVNSLKKDYDYCLIDSPAGIGSGFKLASSVADMAIIVATADSSSLRDGQKTVSILSSRGIENVRLLVNRVNPKTLNKIRRNVDDIIDMVGAQLIGIISEDISVPLAAENETPLILYGAKYAYDQFYRVARRITGERVLLNKL
jgi:septum site-determining protein MinD